MLYHLLFPLHETFAILNVFRYLTFRSLVAFLICLVIVLIIQPYFIKWIKAHQFGQPIRGDGPERHLSKQGTPTMGGLVVVLGIIISTLLLSDLYNIYVWALVFVTASYAALGFIDDYQKVTKRNSKGVRAKTKLLWQILIAALACLMLVIYGPAFGTEIGIPFFKDIRLDLGWFFLPFAIFIVVGCSNAVNLTDGLDGLVIGPVITVAFAYGIFAYVTGNAKIAAYLQIPYIPGVGELSIFAAAIVAGGLGFLWFNSFPASVFMGDVGSLALGGALGMLAIATKQELVLVIAGGIFVVEALSVIFQVASFKLTGKRLFRMAPIHHHFELKGLDEPKIIVRCWIISFVLALLALATLKLR